MGNCIVTPSRISPRISAELMGREKFIMVTRSDGKIMEYYTAPLLVRDLMAAYPQHSVVHSEDATCCSLSPDKKLVPGQLYRLRLIPDSPSFSKDNVLSEARSIDNGSCEGRISRGSTLPFSAECVEDGSGIIRVKMVISKRKLKALLSNRCMKRNSLLLQLQCNVAKTNCGATARCSRGEWRPSLEGIPELI